jgi:hypothetical protein
MKARTLKNTKLGITEDDVKMCNDVDQLLEWKMVVVKDIAEMSHDINMAKLKREQGEESDSTWYYNAIYAKKCQGLLDQAIASRLRMLKIVKEEKKQDNDDDLMRRFVEIASTELPQKTFLKLVKMAQKPKKS